MVTIRAVMSRPSYDRLVDSDFDDLHDRLHSAGERGGGWVEHPNDPDPAHAIFVTVAAPDLLSLEDDGVALVVVETTAGPAADERPQQG